MEEQSLQERRSAEERAEKQSRIKYVKELQAGEKDAWITPVDAARITGVAESMANRWITSGRLPIKGDPETGQPDLVGNPPRTRQVRVSDVAKLHKILYPEQAISPVMRTLDVTSIPLEVARITQEQHQIATDHTQLTLQISALETTVESKTTQLLDAGHQQERQFQQKLSDLGEEAARQLLEAEGRISSAQQQLREDLSKVQTDQEKRHQKAIGTLRTELTDILEERHTQVQNSIENLSAEHRKDLHAYEQTVNKQFQQAERVTNQQLDTLEQQITTKTTTLADRITVLDERVNTATATFETYTQSAQQQFDEVTGQHAALQLQYGELERRLAEQLVQYEDLNRRLNAQSKQLARYDSLELKLGEQATLLAQYEQLLPLIGVAADLQQIVAERRESTSSQDGKQILGLNG